MRRLSSLHHLSALFLQDILSSSGKLSMSLQQRQVRLDDIQYVPNKELRDCDQRASAPFCIIDPRNANCQHPRQGSQGGCARGASSERFTCRGTHSLYSCCCCLLEAACSRPVSWVMRRVSSKGSEPARPACTNPAARPAAAAVRLGGAALSKQLLHSHSNNAVSNKGWQLPSAEDMQRPVHARTLQ